MEFNEKEFKKMVRKANYKRTSMSVLISLLVVGVITSGILMYFNYIDFSSKDNPKVKGLPNSTLRTLDNADGFLGLLFEQSGGFEMNNKIKEMNVYIDYYENGQLKKHDMFFSMSNEEQNSDMNGVFYWGLSDQSTNLKASFVATNGTVYKSGYDLSEFKLDEWTGAGFAFPGQKLNELPKKYLLAKFVKNENGILSTYMDDADEFSEEYIKENNKLVQFYVEFK